MGLIPMIRLKKQLLIILTLSMLTLLVTHFNTDSWSQMFPSSNANDTAEEDTHVEKESMDITTEKGEVSALAEEFNRVPEETDESQQESFQEDEELTPATIEIPAINVETEIESVGVLDNGQMDVPSEEDGVAWFEPGTKPGAAGNSVMAGHVDSYTGPAIFFDLEDLEPGDEIVIRDEGEEELIFTVQQQESYPLGEAPMDDIFGSSDNRNLNLITCAGTFNEDQGTHDERLVVYTELDEEKSDIEQKPDTPETPTNVEVRDSFVSWHAVQDDQIAGYRVYRGSPDEEATEFEQIESVSAHERKRISDTEVNSSEYSYYVTAVDANGEESAPSEKTTEE